ncbi:MAG TPA: heavy metal-binding domain-containing protein [Blastocatellia bacterium]|nr:heavy metal-binding domain-containing protein [Blastocatellia bacterium]
MKIKIYSVLASCIIVLALAFVEPAGASAAPDGHHYRNHQRATKRARRVASRTRHRARAKRKASRRAVSYVCPMHSDIREKSPGTCPKCLMDLVAEPRSAKTGGGAKGSASGVGAGASMSGSMQDR